MKSPQPKSKLCSVWPTNLACALLTALLGLAIALPARAQTYTLSNLWYNANGTGDLANSSANRGLACNALSNQVLVASTAPAISVFDGATGTNIGSMYVTGLSGGNAAIDQVGVAADGVIYACNLQTTLGNGFKIYRWGSWTDTGPLTAYFGNPATNANPAMFGTRMGDTMVVKGAGVNTVILTGVNTSTTTSNFVFFTTVDGTNFLPTIVDVAGLPNGGSGVSWGLAFYTNNTFLVRPGNSSGPSSTLYLVQYPAITNASLQTNITASVIASTPFNAGKWVTIASAPSANLLAAISMAQNPTPVILYTMPSVTAGATQAASNNVSVATGNSNGNETGGVVFGGAGNTNEVYALDTANGLQAMQIFFTAAPVPPAITSQPVGVTGIYPPQTLSVGASGTAPLRYQWYIITATATNSIPGANTNFYTITTPVTNNYEVVITNLAGSTNSAVVTVSLLTPVTNSVVSPIWTLPPGTTNDPWFVGDDNTRGLAYDTNSSRLVVASHSGGTGLYILDGNTGTNLGSLNTSGMPSGATFQIDQVGVGDDGVVYAGNLATAGQTFALSSWPAPTNGATLYVGYQGDPGNGSGERWGDNMAVRGSGTGTQILLTSRGGTNVSLLTTSDGQNFSASTIAVSGVPASFGGNGVAFGAGNTFWAKNYLGALYEIAFDPVALTGSVVFTYSNPAQIPSAMTGVGVDPVHNIFAGVNFSDTPNDLQLFQLTGASDAPVLFDQAFFPAQNANGNFNASVVLKYPRAYAMDVNNGILALQYGVPATTPVGINQNPVGGTVYSADPSFVLSVGVSGSLPIYYQWQFNNVSNLATATNIVGATNRSYTLSFPPVSASGWYDVVVRNIDNSQTSTPVQLTIISPVTSPVVTQVWALAAGSRPYLDTSYGTRGLAYDTNTATLLVSDSATTNIYILNATDGSDVGTLNTAGLPASGYAGFVLDLVGVGDDGVVYGANLANTANGDQFSFTEWPSVAPGQAPSVVCFTGDPGSGSGDRWGDTFAVRGAGVNTEVLCGSYAGTNVVLFTTMDGSTFTPNLIGVAGVPAGFASLGIAFGAGNTFWAKGGHNYDLREIAFDPVALTSSVLENYIAPPPAPGQVPDDLTGIAVDATNNILGGVCFNDVPDDLQLYLLSGNTNAPGLFEQAFFLSNNPNSQENAQVALRAGHAFGLNANNGIVALTYGTPSLTGFSIISAAYQPGTGTTVTWQAFNGHSYQVQYKNSLTAASWTPIGAPVVATGATASYLDSTATGTARYYRVQGH